MPGPGGRIGHAELEVGNSHIMLADEVPEMGHNGPPRRAIRRRACWFTSRMSMPQ